MNFSFIQRLWKRKTLRGGEIREGGTLVLFQAQCLTFLMAWMRLGEPESFSVIEARLKKQCPCDLVRSMNGCLFLIWDHCGFFCSSEKLKFRVPWLICEISSEFSNLFSGASLGIWQTSWAEIFIKESSGSQGNDDDSIHHPFKWRSDHASIL